MIRKYLVSTAAMIAIVAGVAPAVAQTPDIELPAMLQGLNLSSVSVETGRDGMRNYEGNLPDGTEIEADFDMAGNLIKIEADDSMLPAPVVAAALPDAVRDSPVMDLFTSFEEVKRNARYLEVKGEQKGGSEVKVKFGPDNSLIEVDLDDSTLPQSIIDAMLPQAVRGNEVMSQFSTVDHISVENSQYNVKGDDVDGRPMRAMFDDAGNVLRFGRADEMRERRGHAHRGDRKHDEDGAHRRMPHGDGPGGAMHFDTVAANKRLTDAGYTKFGIMQRRGPRITLDATNPDGETVTLELDPKGELVRETAR